MEDKPIVEVAVITEPPHERAHMAPVPHAPPPPELTSNTSSSSGAVRTRPETTSTLSKIRVGMGSVLSASFLPIAFAFEAALFVPERESYRLIYARPQQDGDHSSHRYGSVLSIARFARAEPSVPPGTFRETVLDGHRAFVIKGGWGVNEAGTGVEWRTEAATLVVFELDGQAVVVDVSPADTVDEETLMRVAGSIRFDRFGQAPSTSEVVTR